MGRPLGDIGAAPLRSSSFLGYVRALLAQACTHAARTSHTPAASARALRRLAGGRHVRHDEQADDRPGPRGGGHG
eukprot:3193594-Pyramimonas_sp.AAC.1